MKKNIYKIVLLAVCLLTMGGLTAQTPQQRTTSTIVADVLAQLPAETTAQYNQLMTDLVGTGEEGLMNVINTMLPPGPESNAKVKFALSGWTNFVAKDEAKRMEAAITYGKALGTDLHEETKAFIIRQLERIGGIESIDRLASFLTDKRLVGPASQALATMHLPQANEALAKALENATTEEMKIQLVNAIAQTESKNVEGLLLNLLKEAKTPDLKKTTLVGLSKLGSKASLTEFKKAVANQKYGYGKESITASYIEFLQTLSKTDANLARKEANALLKNSAKTKSTRSANCSYGNVDAYAGRKQNKVVGICPQRG